jgi:polysaccharide export outer membrane protein
MRAARHLFIVAFAAASAGCVPRFPSPHAGVVATPGAPIDAMTYDRGTSGSVAVAVPVMAGPGPRYTLDSGDRLRIVVFGQEGLTNSYSVDAGGNITMPLIGSVKARGLTSAELSGAIGGRLRQGFIREPHVAVEIEAYRPFFILGEVTTPGQYPFVPNMTVETAVAIAGGFSPRAKRDGVTVSRNVQGQIFRGKIPRTYPIQPGDTLVVGERWF